MIPFLKKNKDGKKPPKSTVPRTAQQSIPMQRMFEDGTCRVKPNYYTRTMGGIFCAASFLSITASDISDQLLKDFLDMDTFIIRANRKEVLDMMSMLKKIVLFPISLFVAFLALMAKWLLTLSSYVVAPLMLYIFGCGIYTVCRQTWDQFLILLVAEFICFILFFGATAITEGIGRFSEWLSEL